MTPFKNYSEHTVWRTRLRRGSLYVAVAAMLGTAAACGSDNNGSDWEEVTVQEPTKGVITTIEESADSSFAIVNEQVVESREASRVVIKRLNGRVDTLTLEQARGLVGNQDTVSNHPIVNNNYNHYHHGGGLGTILWWGAMGHLMGRSFSSPAAPYAYSPGYSGAGSAVQQLRNTSVSRTVRMPARARGGFFRGGGGRSFGG